MWFEFLIIIFILFILIISIIGISAQNDNTPIEEYKDPFEFSLTDKIQPNIKENNIIEIRGMTIEHSGLIDSEFTEEFNPSQFSPGYYLIFDTETNGLPIHYDEPPENTDNWPRLLSVGYILLDEYFKVIKEGYHLIRPDFQLEREALEVNGLTRQELENNGEDIINVLATLQEISKKVPYLVAHNMSFDLSIIQSEYIRAGQTKKFSKMKKICTMKKGTSFCEIPSSYRNNGYKWPKLSELTEHCYFKPFYKFKIIGNHHALNDAWLTAKCLKVLYRKNYL